MYNVSYCLKIIYKHNYNIELHEIFVMEKALLLVLMMTEGKVIKANNIMSLKILIDNRYEISHVI